MAEEKLTLTVMEAAKILGISRGLAYERVRQGKLPVIRFGKRLLVPANTLYRLLENVEQQGHQKNIGDSTNGQ